MPTEFGQNILTDASTYLLDMLCFMQTIRTRKERRNKGNQLPQEITEINFWHASNDVVQYSLLYLARYSNNTLLTISLSC